MITLAINTASSFTSIALLENGKLIAEESWKSDNDEAERVMPAIGDLIKKMPALGGDATKIDEVLVIKGPGSFTGLRVGITVANTIAYLNKAKLFAVDSFEYWWGAAEPRRGGAAADADSALLIFAGKGGLYVSLGPEDIPSDATPLLEVNDLLSKHKINHTFGDITEEQKSTLKNVKWLEPKLTFGQTIERILEKNLKEVKIVEPLYLKKPGITQSKKKF